MEIRHAHGVGRGESLVPELNLNLNLSLERDAAESTRFLLTDFLELRKVKDGMQAGVEWSSEAGGWRSVQPVQPIGGAKPCVLCWCLGPHGV